MRTDHTTNPGDHRRRGRAIALAALAMLVGGLAACGGSKGTLTVHILAPQGPDDPFLQATQVRMTVGDNTSTSDVAAGKFHVTIDIDSPSKDNYVRLTVEAIDSAGQVVGRGRSPNFVLLAENSEISVFVGRPGRVVPTDANLLNAAAQAAGRVELAGVSLRGRTVQPAPERAFGVLMLGGTDAAGTTDTSAWLYDPLTHKVVAAGTPQVPRRGAVLVPSADADTGQQAILWGGVPSSGGTEGDLPTTAEVFDPNMSSLASVFQPAAMDVVEAGMPGAVGATVAELKDGAFLASGGRDRKMNPGVADQPLNQAVLLERFPASAGSDNPAARPGVKRLPPVNMQPGPMVAARFGHSATLVALPEGPGLLLFGGLAAEGPAVAELFSFARVEFRALPLTIGDATPLGSRQGHVAAPLQDGRVLILGGLRAVTGMPPVVEDSGLIVDPRNGQVTARPALLSVPRQGAAATLIGDEIVVCGGFGTDGKALATCEFVSAVTGMRARDPSPMPRARAGHLQLRLETDQLLLVGGVGEGGQLPSAIDLFTPLH